MTRRVACTSVDEGFTLLELLVALAVIAAMAATMSMAIMQLPPLKAFEHRLQVTNVADAIVDVIARDLQAAVRLPLIVAGNSTNALFRGGPDGMTFSAVVPTGFERSGLREVTYKATKYAMGETVLRSLRLRRFSPGDDAVADELDLGHMMLRLSYLVVTETGALEWEHQFSAIDRLPTAVLVEIRSAKSRRTISSRVTVLSVGLRDRREGGF